MYSVNLLTVNSEAGNEQDLVKVVEEASHYFPEKSWREIRYFGNLTLDPDVKIAAQGQTFGALLLKRILGRFEKIRSADGLAGHFLGITSAPVVMMHCLFHGGAFKRAVYVVHDFADSKVGIVSLFRVAKHTISKVVAHSLGHHQGLRHHTEPIGLMYSELLRTSLRVDDFCPNCLLKLQTLVRGS